MKKSLLFILLLVTLLVFATACGSNEESKETTPETSSETTPETTKDPLGDSVRTEAPSTEATDTPVVTEAPEEDDKWPEDTSKYTFFQVFEAPEGNPREIVMDYMMKMATIKWTPSEDFTIGWEGPASFDPNMAIKFYKNKTYSGTTYGNTHCSLELFSHFLNENNELKMDNYSYEKIIGNNCSSTMTLAYQQIVDMPITVLKPISSRIGLLKLAGDLKIPEGMGDNWYSNEVFAANGQEAVYNAFATLEEGDILYKSIPGVGHTRMVRKVELSKSASGKLMPTRSYVYCVESTNAWDSSEQVSTWFVDRKYTFTELYDTLFMPVTLEIFHKDNPTYKNAYLAYDGNPSENNIKNGILPGVISSNFPLNYVMITITDENGNIVHRDTKASMTTNYTFDMRKFYFKTTDFAPGNYTLTIRAGIARVGADIATVNFTK